MGQQDQAFKNCKTTMPAYGTIRSMLISLK